MKNRHSLGDSDFFNRRLLLFIRQESGIPLIRINSIKVGVWKLSSLHEQWIVKEYVSKNKLATHIAFTKKLKNRGFKNSYQLFQKTFQLEGRFFALIPFIPPNSSTPFSYQNKGNIEEAFALLQSFHDTTAKFTTTFQEFIPRFEQLEKWQNRLNYVNETIELHKSHVLYPPLSSCLNVAKWSLDLMRQDKDFFVQEPHSIIHGDVASHNFIRSIDRKLYLIDFDLISIAPAYIDYLQLAQRILPIIGWDDEALFNLAPIHKYEITRPFLAALLFPSELLREWIHFQHHNSRNKDSGRYLERVLIQQHDERISFYKRMQERILAL